MYKSVLQRALATINAHRAAKTSRDNLSRKSAVTTLNFHTSSTSFHNTNATSAANAIHLASNLATLRDVQDYVIQYGVGNAASAALVRPLVVVKVGGEVIAKDSDNLVASLKFLRSSGLQVSLSEVACQK
jgi:hypothetical protein